MGRMPRTSDQIRGAVLSRNFHWRVRGYGEAHAFIVSIGEFDRLFCVTSRANEWRQESRPFGRPQTFSDPREPLFLVFAIVMAVRMRAHILHVSQCIRAIA
jgi:hypothetical protein